MLLGVTFPTGGIFHSPPSGSECREGRGQKQRLYLHSLTPGKFTYTDTDMKYCYEYLPNYSKASDNTFCFQTN